MQLFESLVVVMSKKNNILTESLVHNKSLNKWPTALKSRCRIVNPGLQVISHNKGDNYICFMHVISWFLLC